MKVQARIPRLTSCISKGHLSAEDPHHKISADFKLKFRDDLKTAQIDLLFLNPFGQNEGSLSLHQDYARNKVRMQATDELRQHPLVTEWIKSNWRDELRFMLGLSVRERNSSVFESQSAPWRKMESETNREIVCLLKEMKPQNCTLKSPTIVATLDFTSVQCSE